MQISVHVNLKTFYYKTMAIAAVDEKNVVYVAIVTSRKLIYKTRERSHGWPIVLKVGKCARQLTARYKEHLTNGFEVVATLGVIRKPPEGGHNCEKALKEALSAHKLRVGSLIRETYKAATECFEPSIPAMNIIEDFMEAYDDFELHDYVDGTGARLDPHDIAMSLTAPDSDTPVTALETVDQLTAAEQQTLREYNLSDPRSITNKFVTDMLKRLAICADALEQRFMAE